MDCFVALVLVSLAAVVTDECGICYCSPNRERIICAGKGFTTVPDLPREALEHAIGLGLQRNAISILPASYLNSFSQLSVVDVRAQRTPLGCVILQGNIRAGIDVIGKFIPLFPSLQYKVLQHCLSSSCEVHSFPI